VGFHRLDFQFQVNMRSFQVGGLLGLGLVAAFKVEAVEVGAMLMGESGEAGN
jgi:hypothetical protein